MDNKTTAPDSEKSGSSSPNAHDSQIYRSLSENSITTDFTIDSAELKEKTEKKADRKRIRSIKAGSAYIKNYRFSRYQNAITSSMPYRSTTISAEELPIDGIGCFSNASFSWVRRYLLGKDANGKSRSDALPRARYIDSCSVNCKRLLGIYKYDEQTNGRIGGSTSRVAWKFCRTRVIVAILMHMLSILMALIAIGMFLTLTFQAMEHEIDYSHTLSTMMNVNNQTKSANVSDIASMEAFVKDAAKELNATSATMVKDTLTTQTFVNATIGNATAGNATAGNVTVGNVIVGNATLTPVTPSLTTKKPDVAVPSKPTITTESKPVPKPIAPVQNSTSSHLNGSNTTKSDSIDELKTHIRNAKLETILYVLCIPFCIFGMFFFQSASNWINLRTAYRLRTACIASAFTRAMKSSITYNLESHQIMSHACCESELIYALIVKGTQIVGSIFGIIIYYVATLYLLGVRGFWPLWGIFGLVIAAITLAKLSAFFVRRSANFANEKLRTVIDLTKNFANISFLNFQEAFIDRFSASVSRQYHSFFASEMYGMRFCGGLTSALILGALYVIWCDVNIQTETIPILILIVMYAHFVQILVLEFCESAVVFLRGKQSLDKLKAIYTFAQSEPSRSKPSKHLQIYISQAVFDWDHPQAVYMLKKNNEMHSLGNRSDFALNVEELFVPKNQIIGITGPSESGKTSLCYAILGHMKLLKGSLFSRGRLAFFPQHESYIKMGTVKENVCFGSEFDSTQYYRAIALGFLNHDICNELGKDDVPIDDLQLTAEQLQRVDMARAVFCENRDMFIFDDPLRYVSDDAEAALLFKNMSDYLLQTGKTILITTTNEEMLKLCNRVYVLDKGNLSESYEYGDLYHLPSFRKVIEQEQILKSCCRSADNVFDNYIENDAMNGLMDDEQDTMTQRSQSTYLNIHKHYSNDLLIDENLYELQNKLFSISEYLILTGLYLINSFGYIYLPFAFVLAVSTEYIKIWPVIIAIVVLALTFFINIVSKYSIHKAARKSCKNRQRKMFDDLLRSPMKCVNKCATSDIVNTFMVDKFNAFKIHGNLIQYMMMIFVTGALLIYGSFWNSIPVFLMMIINFYIYYCLKYTVVAMNGTENHTRRRMLRVLSNHLIGRSVIQSFDKLEEFRNEFYNTVEENSTSIFLRKSTEYFGEFLFCMVQVFFLFVFCMIYLLLSTTSIYRFAIGIFAFLSFGYNLNKLLSTMFERDIIVDNLRDANNFSKKWRESSRQSNNDILSNKKENAAVTISFNSVSVQIDTKYYIHINKLHIKTTEKIGIKGQGASLITKLLCGILEPTTGVIFIGQYDVKTFSPSYYENNFGIVPRDPVVRGETIRSILDPRNDVLYTTISETLKFFNLWQIVSNLPKELDEPLESLNLPQRQLICLVRCCIRNQSIVIVEYPHPEIQQAVNDAIEKYFIESTVLIIGMHKSQFTSCHRIVDLGDRADTGF